MVDQRNKVGAVMSDDDSLARYEIRYCAYVDILGFSQLIADIPSNAELFRIVRMLLEIVQRPPEPDLSTYERAELRGQSISDAVCLSASLSARSLTNLLYMIGRIALRLLSVGYFVRGAVVKGRLFHDEKMIFGEALIRAYKLESEVARMPLIILAPPVVADIPPETSYFIRQSQDGHYLHVLHDLELAITNLGHGEREFFQMMDECDDMARTLQQRFNESARNPRHFEKVQWFANYWNSTFAPLSPAVNLIRGPGLGEGQASWG
jgi:hypothetical protein